jgi:hypothetical protein
MELKMEEKEYRLQGIITREKTRLTVKNLQAKDLKL